MRNPHEKVERSLLRIIAWILGVIVVLSVAGFYGSREYFRWQQRRLIAQGNAFFAQGDYKRASLNARRILQINPESTDAMRLMAQIAEKTGVAASVDWRRRLLERGLATTDDLIQLARDAIRFEDRGIAELAISRLPADARNRADYHALMAELAFSRRYGVEMERELSEAIRLDPENKEYVMDRAALQLTANDAAIRDRGRQTLLELQREPRFRAQATRHLAEAALREKQFVHALELARELNSSPQKSASDQLILLTALKASGDAGFSSALNEAQAAAADDPDAAAALVSWMNQSGMSREAIAWSAKLPAATRDAKLVAIALSDAYLLLHDWNGLLRLCRSGNWGNVDFLRNALASRAARELGDVAESTTQWAEAKRKVSSNAREAVLLAETVMKWQWEPQAIDLLWLAAKDPVKGEEALRTLYAWFANKQDTQNLYRVLLHRSELHPDDLNVQNNVAQLSLLLGLNAEQGHKLAEQVYRKDPRNPAYASTYAFSLYLQAEPAAAVRVLDSFSEEQRRQPEIAAYYGIFLAAAGDTARAAEFLEIGSRARLLPEEKTLLEKARRALAHG